MNRSILGLALLGQAMVYQDEDGRIVVDQDSLDVRNQEPTEPSVGFGYDDDDYDDFAGDYDDEDDDDMEFGARRSRAQRQDGRRRRQDARRGRKRSRQDFNRAERRRRQDERQGAEPQARGGEVEGASADWASTIVGGSVTTAAAGPGVIKIRLQHDFLADDITFDGSAAGAMVNSIYFGDQSVFSNVDGVPVSIFAVGGQMRKYLKGRSIRGGLDITINVTTGTAADKVVATLTGKKPSLTGC